MIAKNPVLALADSRTFASLRERNFRLLWTGNLISQSGDWMDHIAFNWLVLEMSGSAFYLGMVNLCRAVPIILFTMLGGVAADRVERRKLMIATQGFAMALALILAILVSTGQIALWQVFVIATLRGVMMSMNLPVRQTLISDTVPRDQLMNAISLHSMGASLTRVIGPALGGVLISLVGVAGCFYINGFSFIAVLWTLRELKIPIAARKPEDSSIRQSLGAGFVYIRGHRTILLLVVFALVPTTLGMPYITMLAVFARDELVIGPTGLGFLTSSAALGAVVGTLILASLKSSAPKGAIMVGSVVLFGILLMLFSYNAWVPMAVVLLLGIGAMETTYNSVNNTLLQSNVHDEFRGRVVSTLFLQRGLIPLGTALTGTLTVLLGLRLTVFIEAAVIALAGIVVLVMAPSLYRLR